MQRIFDYEINMALKDRPRVFQLITFALLSLAMTVIVIQSFVHLSVLDNRSQVHRIIKPGNYVSSLSSPANYLLSIKK